ncbi:MULTISPECIES: SMP-30/gluconolactonase/LRE family protein [unclassified Aureimonas]|uniref:SMP-30/gluconolactonase/LRE family protein n=1 Tax=unclassified Aureimonas TaxID=2615206 RepID=UPI000700B997|nr:MULTISPECIES: SMP-30/gluconolactonase/LRE family protein [unclassified Aureimonas]KQT52772.1 gluconolactonase [Aureimonas sp. Leaf427]KQT80231.1 gluconolactonase [Aureimonas sp. Leaf460]
MSDYDIRDPRFSRLIFGPAKLEHLWTGGRWVEGPVYVPAAKSVVWSDIPNDRLLRFDEGSGAVSVFEKPCGYHNGHTLDHQGRIIACEHGGRRISRLEFDGRWKGLVDNFEGKRLNSPNDAVVKSDGSIWFSDPTYGIDTHYEGHQSAPELDGSNVYRLHPESGALECLITDMVKPNGLCFSPDESLLYVADTGATHRPDMEGLMRVYDIDAGGKAVNGRHFATCPSGLFDGIRADTNGNIWASTGAGVAVYAPDGTHIGGINVPEIVSNLCFGGPKRNRLYITGQTSLYSIYVNAHAAGWTA